MAVTTLIELRTEACATDALVADLRSMLPDTRRYDGCHGVDVYRDRQSCRIFLVSRWQSREHHQRYLQWRQDSGVARRLSPMLAAPPVVRYLEPVNA